MRVFRPSISSGFDSDALKETGLAWKLRKCGGVGDFGAWSLWLAGVPLYRNASGLGSKPPKHKRGRAVLLYDSAALAQRLRVANARIAIHIAEIMRTAIALVTLGGGTAGTCASSNRARAEWLFT